jgi:hypothetical protein
VADSVARWCQVVRTPGTFRVHGSAQVQVPPLGGATTADPARAGVRLLGQPVAMATPADAIDMTTTSAIAMLEGFLALGRHVNRELSWTSRGWGVRRRDTIRLGGRQ